jgi:hypothetical protein
MTTDWTIETREDGTVELSRFFEEGGPIIVYSWRNDRWDLFEVPQYGGEEMYVSSHESLHEAIRASETIK